jgi:hypothetical protein
MPYVFGPCPQVVVHPPTGEGGFVAVYDWDDNVHAYGEAVSITACFDAAFVAVPDGPPGVIFDPVQLQLPKAKYHSITFTVTVPEGSTGPIHVRLDYPDGGTFATPPGPVITPSGDGWEFTFPTGP